MQCPECIDIGRIETGVSVARSDNHDRATVLVGGHGDVPVLGHMAFSRKLERIAQRRLNVRQSEPCAETTIDLAFRSGALQQCRMLSC